MQGSASSSNKIEETYIPPVPFTWDCLTIKTLLEQSKPLLDRLEEPLIKKASLLAYKRMGLEVSHPTTHITSVVQQLQSLIDSPLTPDDKQFPEASILIRVLLAWDNEIEQILGEADTQAANTISTSDSPTSKFALEKSLQSIRVELASRISTLEQKVDGVSDNSIRIRLADIIRMVKDARTPYIFKVLGVLELYCLSITDLKA